MIVSPSSYFEIHKNAIICWIRKEVACHIFFSIEGDIVSIVVLVVCVVFVLQLVLSVLTE